MSVNQIKYWLLVSLFLACSLNLHSQYVFRHLDIVDGLSDNQIRNITSTPDGRIAIRTMTMLNIYNGATFEYIYQDRRKDYKWNFNRFLKERYTFKEYYDVKGRIWMKAPDYLSLFDLNSNRFIYDIENELKLFGINRKLKNIFIDDSKNYLFLTDDNRFSLYDISKKELIPIDAGDAAFVRQYGIPYELAQYKNLYWIMYSSGLLRCWDITSREFIMQDTYFMGKISDASNFLCIHPTVTGDLWLMYNNAVSFYNRTDKTWKEIATIQGSSNFFTCLDLDKEGNAWVGTSWSGLRKIDARTHDVETISGLKLNNGGILENDIECVFVDDDNGLWVGTLWQGICYYHPSMKKFKLIQTIQKETLITNESIRCFLEDNDGTILLGTLYEGVLRYDPVSGKISKAFNGFLSKGLILSLYRDNEKQLWVGTFLNGFYCINGKNIKIYNQSTLHNENFTNQNMSRAIYEDANGRYWVSVANQGVGELDIRTGKITMLRDRHSEIGFHRKNFGFYPVDDHTFATFGESGIYYYDTQKDKTFIPEIDDPGNPKFASPNIIYNCVMKDSRLLEWFGTEQGIRIWDEQKKKVYTIDTKAGLSNNSIESMQEDNNGSVWVASANGITKIEIRNDVAGGYEFSLVNFDMHDGLQSGKFFEQSSLKTKNGDLYFGGYNGFNTFTPNKITYNQTKKRPVFTAFRLFNSLINEDSNYNGHKILQKPINNTREIKLNYKENFITFEFSGLNYVNPSRTYYRYKLENFDQNWNETVTSGLGIASYTGLQPGKYRLVVYTANNDKVWSDEPAEISITITPPFWATGYAYIFYVILSVISLFFIWRLLQKRLQEKRAKQEAIERERQKEELDQMKFRFFTNISHEFRTPLTLIMTPLSRLMHQLSDENLKQKLFSIYRNAENMLGLINQLLDFRKLEMGGEKLKLSFDDFVNFAEYVYFAFEDVAASKSIQFTFESDVKQLFMGFDKSKVHKIINNLYSNALKFTPENGYITTVIRLVQENGRQFVRLDIADSGCGIPDKEQDMIFTRFYQSESNDPDKAGSGIGLHLVKEYVELHEGRIAVSSKVGEGSMFSVFFPADLQVSDNDSKIEDLHDHSSSLPSEAEIRRHQEQKTLLIVEDNAELRHFLAEQLKDEFNVLQANDGKQGLEIAMEKYPDLIVSDLMMPVLNGLEMCQRLKTDIQTSHIPIILLTAKLSDETEIESYKAGADSYIAKPFNFEVLLTRIKTLIEQQEKRKNFFHKTIEITPSSVTTTSLDEELMKKALLAVEKNMDNFEYSVDDLASTLALSRRQLSRKFHSIIGLSPSEFITSIRLKRAAQLLKDSQYNISEISDKVGFNTIRNFNQNFKDEFGITPTQYRTENSN